MDRAEMHGFGGIAFKFLPELENLIIDGSGGGIRIVAPDFVQQLLAAKNALRIIEQESQQLEFVCRERDQVAAASGLHSHEIDADVAEGDGGADARPF